MLDNNHLFSGSKKDLDIGWHRPDSIAKCPRGSPLANFFMRSMAVAEGLPEHSKCLEFAARTLTQG